MSSTSSSVSSSPSTRTRSSWLLSALLTITVYILLFSAMCCHAVPVWKSASSRQTFGDDQGIEAGASNAAVEGLTRPDSADFGGVDSILRRCASGQLREESVFVQTLCKLTMVENGEDSTRTRSHEGFVKRGVNTASDRTSFGAFNHYIRRLVDHMQDVSDYQERLNRLQAMGVLDEDYNVIEVPQKTREMMQSMG